MRKDRENLHQRVIKKWKDNPEMDLDELYEFFSQSFASKHSVANILLRNGIKPSDRRRGNWTEICRQSKTPERFANRLYYNAY